MSQTEIVVFLLDSLIHRDQTSSYEAWKYSELQNKDDTICTLLWQHVPARFWVPDKVASIWLIDLPVRLKNLKRWSLDWLKGLGLLPLFPIALSLAGSSSKKKGFYWKAPANYDFTEERQGKRGYSQETTPETVFTWASRVLFLQ